MDKMKKKVLVTMTALLAILSGCGEQQGSTNTQESPKGAAASGPITLKLWSTEKDLLKGYMDAFQAANSNIKLEVEFMGDYDEMAKKVQAGIVSNSLPNVVQLGQRHAIPQIADSGKLLPIESFMSKEEIAQILPGFWQRYTYKDKKWVIPFQSSTPVMYYNKTMLEKQGLKGKR
jgi:sn-glycerol 3-phosphate transport system substrate-binding protein